jgi:Rad3-related DNA helicase
MSKVGWEAVEHRPIEAKFRKTLVDRAKKRTGYETKEGSSWVVLGDSGLSDKYPKYYVTMPMDSNHYRCSCQNHHGGEYRQICSHILYVILARKGRIALIDHPDSEDEGNVGVEESREAAPGADLPAPADTAVDLDVDVPAPEVLLYPGQPVFPPWVKSFFPHQWEGIQEVVQHFSNGKRAVFLDANTGAGKTLIADSVRRVLQERYRTTERDWCVYTCTTKTLQDQVLRDFPYARVIKGRSNYPTFDRPDDFPTITAETCDAALSRYPACSSCPPNEALFDKEVRHCSQCHPFAACPYQVAKTEAATAQLAVANTSYLLYESNAYNAIFTGMPLVIVDEADMLEQEIMRYVEVVLSDRMLKQLGIGPPRRKTIPSSWVEWASQDALPAIAHKRNLLSPNSKDHNERREHSKWANLHQRFTDLSRVKTDDDGYDYIELEEGWVYTGDRGVHFKPIRVDGYARKLLWEKAKRWLLMSATIISPEIEAQNLGLEDHEWAVVSIDSNFDPRRRPIYIENIAPMSHKNKATSYPPMMSSINDLLDDYPDERVLIHTVSYELTAHTYDYLSRTGHSGRLFTYKNAREREGALNRFLESANGVMLAPSFDRGIDLAGDACRVVVIVKIPFPNLGDKQISARLYSKPRSQGQAWYDMQTIRTLVQMSGRAMRTADDYCEIYILDSQFMEKIYRKRKAMLPEWWKKALVLRGKRKGDKALGAS